MTTMLYNTINRIAPLSADFFKHVSNWNLKQNILDLLERLQILGRKKSKRKNERKKQPAKQWILHGIYVKKFQLTN